MILYHGSDKIISKPAFGQGNPANDFGRGFYCTESIDMAKEWACKKNTDGFANRYELNLKGLTALNLNDGSYNILNWLALLTKYRGYWQRASMAEEAKTFLQNKYLIDLSGFDIVIGYRADDSYFSFAQDFIMGTISLQKLSEAMRLGKLGEQIVIKSPKAFSQIKYLDHENADAKTYYFLKKNRDLKARKSYSEMKNHFSPDDIYMIDIIRGRVSDDDLRI